jgi:hypothetical protein
MEGTEPQQPALLLLRRCGYLRGPGRGTGGDYPVATRALGTIESIVGKLEEEITLVSGFLEGGYANRHRQNTGNFAGSLKVQLLEPGTYFFPADGSLLQRAFGQDESEFFASVSACQVFASDGPKQNVADKAEGFVTRWMSEGIVVALEVIEIQHHYRERPPSTASSVDLAFKEFLHITAVVQSGEGVADRLQSEGLAQVKVGDGESDVFGNGGGQLVATNEAVGVPRS